MIYENDIPHMSQEPELSCRKLQSFIRQVRSDHRWKPNGITDNKNHATKVLGRKAFNEILLEVIQIEEGQTHDITKSDFGFKNAL